MATPAKPSHYNGTEQHLHPTKDWIGSPKNSVSDDRIWSQCLLMYVKLKIDA